MCIIPRVKKKSYRKLTEERKLKQKEQCDLNPDNDSNVSKDFKILTTQDIKDGRKKTQQKRLHDTKQREVHRARLRETQRKRLHDTKQ